MDLTVDQFTHDSWLSIVGMGIGYVGILALVLVVLFVIPFLIVWL
ncbi:MAG: hypothetical protein ABEJ84_04025 [Halodesulfurarchaeum sp.]